MTVAVLIKTNINSIDLVNSDDILGTGIICKIALDCIYGTVRSCIGTWDTAGCTCRSSSVGRGGDDRIGNDSGSGNDWGGSRAGCQFEVVVVSNVVREVIVVNVVITDDDVTCDVVTDVDVDVVSLGVVEVVGVEADQPIQAVALFSKDSFVLIGRLDASYHVLVAGYSIEHEGVNSVVRLVKYSLSSAFLADQYNCWWMCPACNPVPDWHLCIGLELTCACWMLDLSLRWLTVPEPSSY